MKIHAIVLLLALPLLPACSRSSGTKPQTGNRPTSFFGTPLATDDEKAEVTSAVNSMLAGHVRFGPAGTASSIHTFPTRRQVEWKNLAVAEIHFQPVTEADKLNGVTKRFLVSLRSDAHRAWDDKRSGWGEWQPSGYVLFPSALILDWKGSSWSCPQADRLEAFVSDSGPTGSHAVPPATGDPGLPPGMRRVR